MAAKGTSLNHPPLSVEIAKSSGGSTILIHFSPYEQLVLKEGHDHELVIRLDKSGNVKTTELVRY